MVSAACRWTLEDPHLLQSRLSVPGLRVSCGTTSFTPDLHSPSHFISLDVLPPRARGACSCFSFVFWCLRYPCIAAAVVSCDWLLPADLGLGDTPCMTLAFLAGHPCGCASALTLSWHRADLHGGPFLCLQMLERATMDRRWT